MVKPLPITFDFATWTQLVPESEIRRLLRFKVRYYFAGGKPGVLPTEALSNTLIELGKYCLQLIGEGERGRVIEVFNYCPTEGVKELRETFANLLRERDGLDVCWEDITITTGSQQAIYAILDVLLNPGDVVIIPRPAYLGFVNAATKFMANIVTVPMTEQGIDPEHVRKAIRLSSEKFNRRPDLIYVIPDSDNPSGTTMPLKRREELFEVALDEGVLIV
ncbi:MAG TPA: aminotransferase class I/II-fold pyridoxal phosphate-dependent enzyme, partial [Candidatus Korarchaeota archaeon]|nr:aminotransferase class I/II-fold pyridoxal phosphate-dependent enzyme [Candidatus Korarchaeota archaeon]